LEILSVLKLILRDICNPELFRMAKKSFKTQIFCQIGESIVVTELGRQLIPDIFLKDLVPYKDNWKLVKDVLEMK